MQDDQPHNFVDKLLLLETENSKLMTFLQIGVGVVSFFTSPLSATNFLVPENTEPSVLTIQFLQLDSQKTSPDVPSKSRASSRWQYSRLGTIQGLGTNTSLLGTCDNLELLTDSAS